MHTRCRPAAPGGLRPEGGGIRRAAFPQGRASGFHHPGRGAYALGRGRRGRVAGPPDPAVGRHGHQKQHPHLQQTHGSLGTECASGRTGSRGDHACHGHPGDGGYLVCVRQQSAPPEKVSAAGASGPGTDVGSLSGRNPDERPGHALGRRRPGPDGHGVHPVSGGRTGPCAADPVDRAGRSGRHV